MEHVTRIQGRGLPFNCGRKVSVIGRVVAIDRQSILLVASDNQQVKAVLEYSTDSSIVSVSAAVEVIGTVTHDNTLQVEHLTLLSEAFNMDAFQSMIKRMQYKALNELF